MIFSKERKIILTKENIVIRVNEILSKVFHISTKYLCDNNFDQPLTGSGFNLSAASMVYLFFEIEKIFKIHIPAYMLDDYAFSSICSISEIVRMCLINTDNTAC